MTHIDALETRLNQMADEIRLAVKTEHVAGHINRESAAMALAGAADHVAGLSRIINQLRLARRQAMADARDLQR